MVPLKIGQRVQLSDYRNKVYGIVVSTFSHKRRFKCVVETEKGGRLFVEDEDDLLPLIPRAGDKFERDGENCLVLGVVKDSNNQTHVVYETKDYDHEVCVLTDTISGLGKYIKSGIYEEDDPCLSGKEDYNCDSDCGVH